MPKPEVLDFDCGAGIEFDKAVTIPLRENCIVRLRRPKPVLNEFPGIPPWENIRWAYLPEGPYDGYEITLQIWGFPMEDGWPSANNIIVKVANNVVVLPGYAYGVTAPISSSQPAAQPSNCIAFLCGAMSGTPDGYTQIPTIPFQPTKPDGSADTVDYKPISRSRCATFVLRWYDCYWHMICGLR